MTNFFNGIYLLLSTVLLGVTVLNPVCSYNWLQFGGSPQHSGSNLKETLITSGNASQLKRIFQVTLPASIDGPIAYVGGVATASGPHDLVFGATMAGGIDARDAHTGLLVWNKQAFTGTCNIKDLPYPCVVHSAVAVEPTLHYVFAYSLDGKVHKYQIGDGTEIIDAHWPELATLKPDLEKQSGSLVFATAKDGHTYLYVPFSSFPGDWGEYQGHIVTINLDTGVQNMFNMVCSDQTVHFTYKPGSPDCPQLEASVWGRSTLIYLPDLDKIFLTTANGDFNPASHDWGISVIKLNPDGTGAGGNPLDSYTPPNYAALNNFDVDMGSTAPALLPVPANSTVRHLALQSGKDGKLRLLNLDNLSGQGGPGHLGGEIGPILDLPLGDAASNDYEVRTAPLVWTNPADNSTWAFISNDFGIAAYQLGFDGVGNPSLSFKWKNTTYTNSTSPAMANGLLYLVSAAGAATHPDSTHGIIRALNPLTGDTLWSDSTIGTIHWSAPVVDNGVLYISDESNHLTAYAVGGTVPVVEQCQSPNSFPFSLWSPLVFK